MSAWYRDIRTDHRDVNYCMSQCKSEVGKVQDTNMERKDLCYSNCILLVSYSDCLRNWAGNKAPRCITHAFKYGEKPF